MHVVVYTVVSERNGSIDVRGPFFYGHDPDQQKAEQLAKEITNARTKDVIIPRVMEKSSSERLPNVMAKAKEHWFPKFKDRTLSTVRVMKRDQDSILCPFREVSIKPILDSLKAMR